MKRLIKKSDLYTDIMTRYDKGNRECAIVYINGEILEGEEHWPIIVNYLSSKNVDINDPKIADEIDEFMMGKKSKQTYIKDYATADKINDEDLGETIMVHNYSIKGISQDELFSKLRSKYPDYDVLTDDDVVDLFRRTDTASKLIKKAKYYDSFVYNNKQLDVFKNPDTKDIRDIRNDENGDGSVRFFLHNNGTLYAWRGNVLHSHMETLSPDLDSAVHLSWSKSDKMVIYLKPGIKNPDDLKQYFNAGKSNLNYCGITGNTSIAECDTSYYKAQNYNFYNAVKSVQEIYDYDASKGDDVDSNGNFVEREKQKEIGCYENGEPIYEGDDIDQNKNPYIWPVTANKRLMKKSEYLDSFMRGQKYYEVFKNPSSSEIDSIKKEFDRCIRGVIYSDGTVFVWPGYMLHNDINDHINNDIDVDQFRFSYEPNYWIFDAARNFSYDEMKKKIVDNKNVLTRFGDINAKMNIYFTTELDFYRTSLQEIEEEEMNKTARLKHAQFLDADYFKDSWRTKEVYTEVYKNPTTREINIVEKANKDLYSTRGLLNDDGLYIWTGDVLHHPVAARFNIKPTIHLIISDKNVTTESFFESAYDMFKKNKDLFKPFKDLGYTFTVMGKNLLYENLSYDKFFNDIENAENKYRDEIGCYEDGEPIYEGDEIDQSRNPYINKQKGDA